MIRKNDWAHPLPFGDSVWVKKSDVEPLVNAVRKMLDEIYEFGSVVSNEYVEIAESAFIKLVGDEAVEQCVQADLPKARVLHRGNPDTCMHPECVEFRKSASR